jgi:hypothetical protein
MDRRRRGRTAALTLLLVAFACSSDNETADGRERGGGAYGCWCGKDFPLPDEDPPAMDDWDRACRRHDLCYRRNDGQPSEYCDRRLVSDFQQLYYYHGRIPGQLQVGMSHFVNRITGQSWYSGWFSPTDIVDYFSAGEDCDE